MKVHLPVHQGMPGTPGMSVAAGGAPRSWRATLAEAATLLSGGLLAGLICGAVIGGIGGRLAMLLLRLTSDDTLAGRPTDDGFAIGAVTTDTLFLIAVTTALGAVGGLIYLGLRLWLPPRLRPMLAGLLAATAGGALIIHPNGVDFTMLTPRWLAVVLFVLLPAAYGISVSIMTERLLRAGGGGNRRWQWLALIPLVLIGPAIGTGGLVTMLVAGLLIAANRAGHINRWWRSTPVIWLGRALVTVAISVASVYLVRDVLQVL